MRQYDVYRNPSERSRANWPYVVVLQSNSVDKTASVIAAPLSADPSLSASRLYPTFLVADKSYILLTPDLASIPRHMLTDRVGSLRGEWDRITAALDILFIGF